MKAGTKKTILIVDDVFSNQRSLQSILKQSYLTVVAENGVEALKILEGNQRIDLMLLDIHMPMMDGFEVLKALGTDHLPVVVITSDEDLETELKAIKMGAQDFITKPFKPTLITHRIRNLLEKAETANTVRAHQMLIHSIVTMDYDMVMTIHGHSGICQIHNLLNEGPEREKRQDYQGFITQLVEKQVAPDSQKKVKDALALKTVTQNLKNTVSYEYVFKQEDADLVSYKKAKYSKMDDGSHLLMTLSDITRLKMNEQQQQAALRKAYVEAKKANGAKTDFLSRMSHDLRTPLNAVIGFANLAAEDTKEPQTADYLQKISASGSYLLGLINDVLDMTKIDSGAMVLHREPYPLADFIDNVESVIRPMMKKNKVNFNFTTRCDNVSVSTDKLRLNQIIFNLLSNAAKFTPAGGKVDFTVEVRSKKARLHHIRFTVEDNGVGMSEAFQKKMFDVFAQERSTHISNEEGSGLGLSIVYYLVTLMGGSISCESQLNKGTKFVIELDLTVVEKRRKPTHKATPDTQALEGKDILLCEDHPLNQQITVKLLEKKGAHVEVAANGEIGVKRFSTAPAGYYDAILMDIRMPVMDGLTATRAIRHLERSDAKTIPIIAMTANAFEEDVRESHGAGMNAHLSKPINPQALYHCLDQAINHGVSDNDKEAIPHNQGGNADE